ncbi:MAG: motility associated factor glycosyltransferase family protein [Deltaproteobacteria bacterium]|nr:motility associated factor glycosyltransferase family protein [Deltaproteobacteria bacterium]
MTEPLFLKSNLHSLHQRNPGLAEVLSHHDVPPDVVQIAETQDGVCTVRYRHWNGDREVRTWLHSRYHPILEASRFAEKQTRAGQIFLYGFGLGYHVRALRERLHPSEKICVMDANLDLLKTAFSLQDLSDLISSPQIDFVSGLTPEETMSWLKTVDSQGAALVIFRPAVACLGEGYEQVKLFLTNRLLPGAVNSRQELAASNHYANLRVDSKPIQELYLKHADETAFIISSGPSLLAYCNVLPRHRDSVRLYCVGSALKFIADRDIIPDYVVILDAMSTVREQLRGYERLQVPLLFSSFACADAVAAYSGPRYMYLCEALPGFPAEQVISTGGSVANAAMDIALKSGVDKVVFIGQDLCWAGGQHHAPGSAYGQNTAADDSPLYVRARNIHGEWVSTRQNMLNYRQWFEDTIARHPEVDFYNLADSGLPIAGAPVITPSRLTQIINGLA